MRHAIIILVVLVFIISCSKEKNLELESIELDRSEILLQVDQDSLLSIINFQPDEPEEYSVEWFSNDTDIVDVKDGVVTGISPGKASVYAQINDVRSPSCEIRVKGVFDENNDVYITGSISKAVTYWKNGISVALTSGSNFADGYSIFVADDDVYVAGYEQNDDGIPIAKYWKNGQETILSEKSSKAHDIVVADNNVYVVGYEIESLGENIATIWINGEANALSDGTDLTRVF